VGRITRTAVGTFLPQIATVPTRRVRAGVMRLGLRDGAAGDDPLDWLAGDLGDQLVVGVVMQHRAPIGRRRESGTAIISSARSSATPDMPWPARFHHAALAP
jgi:hypothetical protein